MLIISLDLPIINESLHQPLSILVKYVKLVTDHPICKCTLKYDNATTYLLLV